ncbi:MAG TPA: hypothetical protein VFU43_04725 [Streptosporangiaceae bacterium]|nr:hypothetical protein [Streptosporangiaceae bacterium]
MDTDTERAGRLLARLTVAPALIVMAWLIAGLPLLFAGVFAVGPVLALFVPVAGLLLWLGLRGAGLPGAYGDPLRGYAAVRVAGRPPGTGRGGGISWWVIVGVVAVAAGFLALQLAMKSEQIIVRRDPASYVQFATWLADHGSLPIPQMRWAFGGGDPALSYGSPAFFQRGGVMVPQFMAGLPMILAAGGWLGGTQVMLAMPAILGACAVLAFGGLTARLVGPRWAPFGALALALTLPMMYVSRSTYSEVPALILLLGGLALIHDTRADVARRRPGVAATRAFLGGLALGLIVVVRIDGLRDILPVVVFAGLLVARRRGAGLPLFTGLALGAGAGLTEGYVLSRPYLEYLSGSLDPLLLMATAIVMTTVIIVTLLWWPPTGEPLRRLGAWIGRGRVPDLSAIAAILVVIAFAVRPYVQTVTRRPVSSDDRLNALFIKTVQMVNGLPVRPDRTYAEISLYWVVWYIGLPALLLAAFGAAMLARRLLRRQTPEWALPYGVIAWSTVTTLLRPGITPDHPWASRRLAAVVVPGLLLFGLWALAWIVRRVRRLGYSPQVTGVVAGCGAIVLLVPVVAASAGIMFTRTEQGEVAAVRRLCAAIGPGASVVIAQPVTADRFSQVIRGMCGVPVARTPRGDQEATRRVIAAIDAAGRRPVVLGAGASDVSPFGAARQVMGLRTRQDEHTLVTPPNGTWSLTINVWMAQPPYGR